LTDLCKLAGAFADGELPAAALPVYGQHLADCDRCARELELIFALKGLAETALPARAVVTEQIRVPRRVRWGWLSVDALGLLTAVAAVTLVALPRGESWVTGPTRSIEPRLTDPRADVFRPFDQTRGSSGVEVSYDGLGELQRKNDIKGLVSRLLLQRQVADAERLLAGSELDQERAVAALLAGRPEEGLGHSERALARTAAGQAGWVQARWNRALALREMGLGRAAAAAFRAVEAVGEPGWSGEAGLWARKLEAQVAERKQRFEDARAAAERMVRDHTPPATAIIDGWPDLVRDSFYEALRTAPSANAVSALAPVAQALDAHYGGHTLGDFLAAIERLDFAPRRPLASHYTRFLADEAKVPPTFARTLRGAGAPGRDLLLGMVLAAPKLASGPGELVALAALGHDPWLEVEALGAAARLETDMAVSGARETLLRRGIALATQHHFPLLRLDLEWALSVLLLRQQRPVDADPIVRQMLTTAQALRLFSQETRALAQLAHLSMYEKNRVAARAYAEEVALTAGTCSTSHRSVEERLAEQAMNEGDVADARRALGLLAGCPPAAR
jgi:hypothetical protein